MNKIFFGFEQEINVWDKNNIPVNYIDSVLTSKYILDILYHKPAYKKLKNNGLDIVKPELDASQLELYNPLPYDNLEQAQHELYECFLMIESIVRESWYSIMNAVVPNQLFDPIHSWAKDYYQDIHTMLMSHSIDTRKATNITGTHMTLGAWDNRSHHKHLSHKVRELLLNNDLNGLHCHPERLRQYEKVVSVLSDQWMVSGSYIPPIADDVTIQRELWGSYSLVRPKQLDSWVQLTELRAVDGPVNAQDVLDKSQFAHDFVMDVI